MSLKFKLTLCFYFFFVLAFAQTNKKLDLQKKKEQLKKDIEYTNYLLNETREKKTVSLNQLLTLNKKITIREELINTISDELSDINHRIAQSNMQIESLSRELEDLKNEYAKMIRFAYKNQSAYERMMFLFSSKDFNQAYRRLKYLQQYSTFRKKQAELIQEKQKELNQKVVELLNSRLKKKDLLVNEEHEKKELDFEKSLHTIMVTNLQDREKQLKKDLKEKQRAEENLNRAIEELVRKEIEEARRKAEAAGKKNVNKSNVFNLSAESVKASADFEGNKGRLPWPVDKGVITGNFGVHPHPALKGILLNNNGIDITSSKGAVAKAIFDGQVTGIVSIPGANKSVIIRHGDYLSVYSNLEEVNVKRGDKIQIHQQIGTIQTDPSDSKTELNLQIWKGETRLDPAEWIHQAGR